MDEHKYLAGGTAAAIYLGHRRSIDFDFFSETPFDINSLMIKFKENFKDIQLEIMEEHTLICYIQEKNPVKFSLFYYPYKILEPKINIGDLFNSGNYQIFLAHLLDIACMKAIAIAQRGTAKDFIDLYFILNSIDVKLSELFVNIKAKYDLGDSYLYNLKNSLIYFDDALKDLNQIALYKGDNFQTISEAEWENIKKFFTNYIK
ncbi:nucleotidyl transferase AbiEii/AbiGii toxin family protein [bacterium]|nr:nucleotidyl transferase AbiEii/AbiGii toxin family protein [bacterium]